MARKDVTAILTEIASTLADNTSQAITPAILRTVVKDITDLVAPSYGVLAIETPSTVSMGLTTVDQIITFTSNLVGGATQYSIASNTTITSDQRSTNRISITMDIEGPNGRAVTVTVYENGVVTPLVASITTAGAGNPQGLNMSLLRYKDPGAAYTFRIKADAGGTFIISNTVIIIENVPVFSFV
jgi:hypothetical protein